MLTLDAAGVRDGTPWPELVEALREMFATGCTSPVRHHHTVGIPGEPDATLLLMPAWVEGDIIGIKVAQVTPGNGARGLPAVQATYLLNSGRTGETLANLDGAELTVRRTAAASALAADYLARHDARTLLMVGTGRLAPNLIQAHASIRPLTRVLVWGRDPVKAEAVASQIWREGVQTEVVEPEGLQAACGEADIVSCATLSNTPLISGDWLPPGVHLDLVGGFRPTMREADDACIRACTVFVDTRAGAFKEAGDIVAPLESGVLSEDAVPADLYDLACGTHPGRRDATERTLFKSVGASLEDLAAARLIYRRSKSSA